MFYVPDVSDETKLILGVSSHTLEKYAAVNRRAGQIEQVPRPLFPQQQWVKVNAITRELVSANIEQPDPDRLVLCACINKYGGICYGYYDEVPRWYRIISVLAVVFAIIATPLSLLCFIPALKYMKKVL